MVRHRAVDTFCVSSREFGGVGIIHREWVHNIAKLRKAVSGIGICLKQNESGSVSARCATWFMRDMFHNVTYRWTFRPPPNNASASPFVDHVVEMAACLGKPEGKPASPSASSR